MAQPLPLGDAKRRPSLAELLAPFLLHYSQPICTISISPGFPPSLISKRDIQETTTRSSWKSQLRFTPLTRIWPTIRNAYHRLGLRARSGAHRRPVKPHIIHCFRVQRGTLSWEPASPRFSRDKMTLGRACDDPLPGSTCPFPGTGQQPS